MDRSAKGDVRKQEFLRVALDLFHERGYEKTTIQAIIDKMGVSKGAFYHYFDSKEDVVKEIAREYARRALVMIKDIAERDDLTALEKLNAAMQSVNQYKVNVHEERQKIKGLFRDNNNLQLERELVTSIKEAWVPVFQQIVDAGVAEGTFRTNPREVAEFTFNTMFGLNTAIHELTEKLDAGTIDAREYQRIIDEKLSFYEKVLEAVLGAEAGSVSLKESYLLRLRRGV